ncbi:MAG: Mitochondrial zinc maintenance protein 1, mitochondrial [Icmadophila ericetorum]|nr:Mitochondrial zinc maintenance protein 1, mitochondrial [Icmadophila ericetorum]
MPSLPNPGALAAYRHLLRATRIAFQGDNHILLSARHQARTTFSQNSTLAPESPEALTQIRHVEEVAVILRRNIVQGEAEAQAGGGGGKDDVGETGDERWKFRLRLHEEIERGDNESVKSVGRMGGWEEGRW